MSIKRILITGASGCVGHYIIEKLLSETCECHLLLRDPSRLKIKPSKTCSFVYHTGNLEDIEPHLPMIASVDAIIHIATNWNNSDYADFINDTQTHRMFKTAFDGKCQKAIYFSTASILGPNNSPVPEAKTHGTGYVRSKYLAHQSLETAPYKNKVVTLFPTLVIGGTQTYPLSHISKGIRDNIKSLNYLRFITANASCHFLHTADIATITHHLLYHDTNQREYVLGNSPITLDTLINQLCQFYQKKRWFKIPLNAKWILKLAALLRIEIDPWTHYCIQHPHMVYDTVNPSSFGLETKHPTFESILTDLQSLHV